MKTQILKVWKIVFYFFLKIYLFERERERKRARKVYMHRGRGRGREREADSPLSTKPDKGLDRGLHPKTLRPRPKSKNLTLNRLSHPGAPGILKILSRSLRKQQKQEGYFDLLVFLLPRKQEINLLCERYPLSEKETPLSRQTGNLELRRLTKPC